MIEKLCGEANVDAKDVIIAYLTKQVQELESQLYEASIQIQELTEQDMWCPSNCEKLEKLQQENKHLDEVNCKLRKTNEQLKEKLDCDLQWAFKYEKQVDNWNKLKEFMSYENIGRLFDMGYDANDFINEIDDKIKELEGSDSDE